MKKFRSLRKFEDILKKAEEKGFEYYELESTQRFKNDKIDICLRSFGKFIVYDKKWEYLGSESSAELDNEEWYLDILDMFYESKEE